MGKGGWENETRLFFLAWSFGREWRRWSWKGVMQTFPCPAFEALHAFNTYFNVFLHLQAAPAVKLKYGNTHSLLPTIGIPATLPQFWKSDWGNVHFPSFICKLFFFHLVSFFGAQIAISFPNKIVAKHNASNLSRVIPHCKQMSTDFHRYYWYILKSIGGSNVSLGLSE